MAMTHFSLVSDWHFTQSIDRVWALIEKTEDWPLWWRAVKRVEVIREGDADGLGAIRRITWATALPYTLAFDVEVTRIEKPHCLEGRAFGELEGLGTWNLHNEPEGTHVRYSGESRSPSRGCACSPRCSRGSSPGTTTR